MALREGFPDLADLSDDVVRTVARVGTAVRCGRVIEAATQHGERSVGVGRGVGERGAVGWVTHVHSGYRKHDRAIWPLVKRARNHGRRVERAVIGAIRVGDDRAVRGGLRVVGGAVEGPVDGPESGHQVGRWRRWRQVLDREGDLERCAAWRPEEGVYDIEVVDVLAESARIVVG